MSKLLFDLKILEFKLKESLEIYKRKICNENFELLKTNIDELCTFITNRENQLTFFKVKNEEKIYYYITSIRELSNEILKIIEKEEAISFLKNKENNGFQYRENLRNTIRQEIHDYDIEKGANILFVGSGAIPITAFTIKQEIDVKITCVDIDKEALVLSKKVAQKLGVTNIYFENDIYSLNLQEYTHIIIASLVFSKHQLLREIESVISKRTKVILRYGNELKELFNYKINLNDIKNFFKTIIKDNNFIYDSLILERE